MAGTGTQFPRGEDHKYIHTHTQKHVDRPPVWRPWVPTASLLQWSDSHMHRARACPFLYIPGMQTLMHALDCVTGVIIPYWSLLSAYYLWAFCLLVWVEVFWFVWVFFSFIFFLKRSAKFQVKNAHYRKFECIGKQVVPHSAHLPPANLSNSIHASRVNKIYLKWVKYFFSNVPSLALKAVKEFARVLSRVPFCPGGKSLCLDLWFSHPQNVWDSIVKGT